jgi:hypothetical protein
MYTESDNLQDYLVSDEIEDWQTPGTAREQQKHSPSLSSGDRNTVLIHDFWS